MSVAAEQFLAGKDATIVLGDSPTTQTLNVEDGHYDRECHTDETTNTQSGGYYQSTPTTKKWSGNIQAVYVQAGPPTLTEGQLITMTLNHPYIEQITGSIRITKIHSQTMTVKGACRYNFDFENYGSYTVTQNIGH